MLWLFKILISLFYSTDYVFLNNLNEPIDEKIINEFNDL